jgi:hypothetical protein
MNQTQREATLDLLILSIYADSHISLVEEEALQNALQNLGWESVIPRDIYFCNSLRRARDASADEPALAAYLMEKTAVFQSQDAKAEALKHLGDLIKSDGTSPDEGGFLAKLHAALSTEMPGT